MLCLPVLQNHPRVSKQAGSAQTHAAQSSHVGEDPAFTASEEAYMNAYGACWCACGLTVGGVGNRRGS